MAKFVLNKDGHYVLEMNSDELDMLCSALHEQMESDERNGRGPNAITELVPKMLNMINEELER